MPSGQLTKSELSELLHSIPDLQVNEGVTALDKSEYTPRIVYWDYIWQDICASGETYAEVDTYQLSFFSKIPRDPALIALRNKLREKGIRVTFYHEYIEDKQTFHSYCNLDVINDVEQ